MAKLPQITKARICKYCEQELILASNSFSNHVKHCKKRPESDNFKKLSEAIRLGHDRRLGEVKSFKVVCSHEKCENSFEVREREFKFPLKEKYFCSRKCSNSRERTPEVCAKISKSVRSTWRTKVANMTPEEFDIRNNKGRMRQIFTSKGERELLQLLQERLPEYEFTSGGSIKIDKTFVQRDIISKVNKIVIEYDGPWHFVSITGEENLKKKQHKDQLLNNWCRENDFKLIRVSPFNFRKFPNLFDKLVDLIINNSELYQEMYDKNLNEDVQYVLRNTISDYNPVT